MTTPLSQLRRQLLQRALAGSGVALLPLLLTSTNATAQAMKSSQPRRVAVAGGAITEIVYALNAEAMLVGADTTSTYPAAAQALAKIGYQRALSAEGVLSLHPDLLLTSAEAGPPAALTQIAAAGVKVVRLGIHHDVQVVRDRILGTATALNLSPRGDKLLQRFDADWQTALAAVAGHRRANGKPPRVMFILNNSGTQAMVAGRDTAADAMIRYAGAINALGGEDGRGGFTGYKPLTAESAVLAAPDVLMLTSEGLAAIGGINNLISTPGIAITSAAKNRRVVADMDSLLLLGFGPRMPEALTKLSAQLHA
ncbi:hemin ABC transporter substrate-binding protein [Glaciimonas sp. PCH181]|uniref:heme/hemin ABC transporter substrate-binding protein n=1 Tax=Glaciimonas sp. PCH181 TaxID=2133943 RepID=UPI000D3BE97E|nr:ABC transporter substrate-binding protein [Glaciimonas sp. PCH181]PUA17908.1 hemin ABC transporter substrate-binding protein [Glaciimonas sp. PCH181]